MDMTNAQPRVRAPEDDGEPMMHILPVGDPIVLDGEPFDPDSVPFEELPFTSWAVDAPDAADDPVMHILPVGEPVLFDEPPVGEREPVDPGLLPDEDHPFTSVLVGDPGEEVMHILPVGEPIIHDGDLGRADVEPDSETDARWEVDETPTRPTDATDGEGDPEVGLQLYDPDNEPTDGLPVRITTTDEVDTASIEAAIGRIYEVALGREADADGLTFWSGVVADGATLGQVADAFADVFMFEDETGDELDDAEFVAGLYSNGLDREADEAGLDYWLDRLADTETDRGDLVMAFADAEEVNILS